MTGVTISREQLTEAKARVKAEGLEHLVDLRFCDYRHLPKVPTFDRVVSIEMIEAVSTRFRASRICGELLANIPTV